MYESDIIWNEIKIRGRMKPPSTAQDLVIECYFYLFLNCHLRKNLICVIYHR